MEILKVIVDKLPHSCEECCFFERIYVDRGFCEVLEYAKVSTIPNCMHKDCPLVIESEE